VIARTTRHSTFSSLGGTKEAARQNRVPSLLLKIHPSPLGVNINESCAVFAPPPRHEVRVNPDGQIPPSFSSPRPVKKLQRGSNWDRSFFFFPLGLSRIQNDLKSRPPPPSPLFPFHRTSPSLVRERCLAAIFLWSFSFERTFSCLFLVCRRPGLPLFRHLSKFGLSSLPFSQREASLPPSFLTLLFSLSLVDDAPRTIFASRPSVEPADWMVSLLFPPPSDAKEGCFFFFLYLLSLRPHRVRPTKKVDCPDGEAMLSP